MTACHMDQLVCQQRWRLGQAVGTVAPGSGVELSGHANSNCTLAEALVTSWVLHRVVVTAPLLAKRINPIAPIGLAYKLGFDSLYWG